MIRPDRELAELERRHARVALAGMSYRDALAQFKALWAYALRLDPGFPGDWQHDIAADLELARVLNGLDTGP